MEKIPTIFDRNWDTNRKVNEQLVVKNFDFANAIATEKLDGTNVRVTVRNHIVVRLEKRRNPDKLQKAKGIVDPWYVDAKENDSEDTYIFDALKNTNFSTVPDGEWSAEALGEKIQGNPLQLIGHTLFIFSLPDWLARVTFDQVPTDFEALKHWLPKQQSKFGQNVGIEGIVWHHLQTGQMCKIKIKDFDYKV